MTDNLYCSEKIQFMKAEILTIKDLIVSESSFRTGDLKKAFTAIDGKEEILIKDAEISTRYRKTGNFILKKRDHTLDDHLEIWNYYSKCIASAPKASTELAQGYFNRSSFFFHIGKYQESIDDVDKAFALEISDEDLKLKLDRQKSKCLIKLIREMVYVEDKKDDGKGIPETKIEIFNKNEQIPCASDVISINYSKKYGRFIVANRDINPGELIVKEKFYSLLFFGDNRTHCANCCKLVYSSIPCESCAYAVYCSEACKNKAWDDYHKIECVIVKKINIKNCINNFTLLSLKTLLKILNEVKSIELLKKYLEEVDNCSGKNFKVMTSYITYIQLLNLY